MSLADLLPWPEPPPGCGIDDALAVYVIFDHPSDYPQLWVVRRQFATRHVVVHDPTVRVALDLEGARAWVPDGLYRLPRQEGDDPVIVETWM